MSNISQCNGLKSQPNWTDITRERAQHRTILYDTIRYESYRPEVKYNAMQYNASTVQSNNLSGFLIVKTFQSYLGYSC